MVRAESAGAPAEAVCRLPTEAELRVQIVDALEATVTNSVRSIETAIQKRDTSMLSGIGLSNKQITSLLNSRR